MYQFFTGIRNYLFDKNFLKSIRVPLPVICIGNITAGGNGKTPLVCEVVKFLESKGKKPVILSRGYGGKLQGPHLISEHDGASEVGDEPLMMSRKLSCPVVIARRRVEGAKFIVEKQIGNVIVLDDGYQHRQLDRDLNVVVSYIGSPSSTEAFLRGRVLPFGRFREERDAGLRRAHAIVFAHRKPEELAALDERLLRVVPAKLPCFESFIKTSGVVRASGERVEPQKVFLFCAIASPEAFVETVEREGYDVIGKVFYPDHYEFKESSLIDIFRRAGDALPVCTEKDFVKLPSEFQQRAGVLKIQTYLKDEKRFYELVNQAAGLT